MLEVDGLVRTYGEVRALDGMSFTVEPGSVTGFLGPNGSGKTTTMRAIFGLVALDAGAVRFDGRPVDHADSPALRIPARGAWPVPDDARARAAALPRPAARAHARRTPTPRPTRWLAELGLADRADDELEHLSLGNQQRVQLIGALIHQPDVLVLDEPFSGLDPVAVDALSKVLVAEARRGRDGAVLVAPARPRRGPLRAGGRRRSRSCRCSRNDRRADGRRRPGAGDRRAHATSTARGQPGSTAIEVIDVSNGRVRLTLHGADGTAAERAQAALDAARQRRAGQPLRVRPPQPVRGVPDDGRPLARGAGSDD